MSDATDAKILGVLLRIAETFHGFRLSVDQVQVSLARIAASLERQEGLVGSEPHVLPPKELWKPTNENDPAGRFHEDVIDESDWS